MITMSLTKRKNLTVRNAHQALANVLGNQNCNPNNVARNAGRDGFKATPRHAPPALWGAMVRLLQVPSDGHRGPGP